jgi:integrase
MVVPGDSHLLTEEIPRNITIWSSVCARTAIHISDVGRLYALWAVALAMGLRRGEALGLAWADADLDRAG